MKFAHAPQACRRASARASTGSARIVLDLERRRTSHAVSPTAAAAPAAPAMILPRGEPFASVSIFEGSWPSSSLTTPASPSTVISWPL